jgi:hypothetical protein
MRSISNWQAICVYNEAIIINVDIRGSIDVENRLLLFRLAGPSSNQLRMSELLRAFS